MLMFRSKLSPIQSAHLLDALNTSRRKPVLDTPSTMMFPTLVEMVILTLTWDLLLSQKRCTSTSLSWELQSPKHNGIMSPRIPNTTLSQNLILTWEQPKRILLIPKRDRSINGSLRICRQRNSSILIKNPTQSALQLAALNTNKREPVLDIQLTTECQTLELIMIF